MLFEDIQAAAPIRRLTSPAPRLGELVQVRSRRWLVDEVIEPKIPGQTSVVRLSCADDGAQGRTGIPSRGILLVDVRFDESTRSSS
jgi:hypothetical protein